MLTWQTFYVLSEIIPTLDLVFFTAVTTLGISFSSRAVNGFVFFRQVIDVFSQDLIFSQSHNKAKAINVPQAGHQLLYEIFNIEFFFHFMGRCISPGYPSLQIQYSHYYLSLYIG